MTGRYQRPEEGAVSDRITPGERRELRSVVRQQIKVLRAEVEQRRLELLAEAEARLAEKYREDDRLIDELNQRLARLAEDANRQLADLLDEYGDRVDGQWRRYNGFLAPTMSRNNTSRDQLRHAMRLGINAQVKQAELQLNRQEADLLRDLAVDSLETTAARAFLGRIPTVAELVPSRRLREIEAQFDAQAGGTR